MFYITAFIFGSIWGSFANVCIHRLPQGTSVTKGRSNCPSCNQVIKWFDNIPLISFILLKHFIIPNELSISLMIIGFLKSFDPNLNKIIFPNFINSLIGGLIGYFIVWLIIYFYKKLRNKEGMGLGDAKLLSAIGFWFGWISLPFVLFFSSAIALISFLPDLIKNKKSLSSQIPFGPFIILGTILFLFSKTLLL